ncbi:MAG: Zn-ribbon domain-containing OB-fold protein [Candidatus Latescibacterota bacterium]|jgi:uncharacterized OB-fold protein
MLTPAKNWREYPQRYRLEAGKCTGCGKVFFPPRLICDKCRGEQFEAVTLPSDGKLVTFTAIHVPASNFKDEAPIAYAVVELEDGTRISSQVTDCSPDDLKAGDPVRLEFRRVQHDGESGILCYGYKAVLKR